MTVTVYVPRDSAACSVGADDVAAALAQVAVERGADCRIVRTGSRGALFLEPLVEIEAGGARVGYGPVAEKDVQGLFDAGFLDGKSHPLFIGPVAEHPFLSGQERIIFSRCGLNAPLDFAAYKAFGGMRGAARAAAMSAGDIIEEIARSGLRGRGGAGFPAGLKWRTAAAQPGETKYVCCNADEGDSGTFADRLLMEGDPFTLIEGMVIAGLAIGAAEGFVYIRSEYPAAINVMKQAISRAEEEGLLGDNSAGSGRAFRLRVRRGGGAYICGEESAMLESLEGQRGEVRARPPIPAVAGLFGRPTLVHNVLSLASVPAILAGGGRAYAGFGTGRSLGTQAFQLGGNIKRGGLVEAPFGISLRHLIEEQGGGTASGRPVGAVQLGGPLGAYLPASQLDIAMDYEALAGAGAMLGHGGIVVFDDSVDMARQAEFAMRFCAAESCGKCTPCRIGSVRGAEVIAKMRAGENTAANKALLDDLCEVMTDGSLCAMGGLTPMPVRSALKHWPGHFGLNQQADG